MKCIKFLSLFSGIGAFEKALRNLGIDYELVGFSEIDKYAVKSYCAVHDVDESKNLGDITKIDTSKLPKDIDLISYGFPCQDISLAGKQKGFEHDGELTRSGLFFEALRIIEDTRPKIAIAENVKNLVSKKFSKEFGIVLESLEQAGYNNYWKVLNAKDFGIPQNRERVFIVSIRKDIDDGGFKFPDGFELKLRLKDMLENQVDEKYYLTNEHVSKILSWKAHQKPFEKVLGLNSVSPTLTARGAGEYHSGMILVNAENEETSNMQDVLKIREATQKGYAIAQEGDGVYINRPHQKRGCVQKGMIQTLKTTSNDVGVVVANGCDIRPKDRNYNKNGTERADQLEMRKDELSNTLLTVHQHNMVAIEINQDGVVSKPQDVDVSDLLKGTVYDRKFGSKGKLQNQDGVCDTLLSAMGTGGGNTPIINNNLRIRKLTPKECWRLMGFSDEDFHKAEQSNSNTQLYKQAGNSIVVNVLMELFKNINMEEEDMKKIEEITTTKYETDKMINLAKLMDEEPELFEELVSDYPCEPGRYVFDVIGG